MSKVLVAGATGHLGRALVPALAASGHEVFAMCRDASSDSLAALSDSITGIREGDASQPETLAGVIDVVDTIVSTIGLTKPVKHLSFDDVDWQCNANLLQAAEASAVARFVYVSVAGIDLPGARGVAVLDAKARFEEALRLSPLKWSIVRPSGYFWNYGLFLQMAREHGVVPVLGNGNAMTTPVYEADLAAAICDHLDDDGATYTVGGPDDLSANDVGELISTALGKKIHIVHVPDPVTEVALDVMKPLSRNEYDTWAFFHWTMTAGATADHVGTTHLADWLVEHRRDSF